jgi:hypothetical protein
MPTSRGYVLYEEPTIKCEIIKPEIGVAAFVTSEQIDHYPNDKQMRFELYVMLEHEKKSKVMVENHGYDHEGGAMLNIIDVEEDYILIETKEGKRKIILKS